MKMLIDNDRVDTNISETKSSAESWSFNILVDVLTIDWLFDYFSNTEWSIAWWIEIFGLGMEGSLFISPSLDVSGLFWASFTYCVLSFSARLTIWPKEGMTLMLMLLILIYVYPSSEIEFWKDISRFFLMK